MKIKKKKIRKVNKLFVLVVLLLIINISASLYISPLIIKLSYEIEDTKNQIKKLKEENEQLKIFIGELSNKQRITTIATQEGLSYNQDSIIYINTPDE